MLELEAAILTMFAAFWSWNLSFRWNLQHFGARNVHVTCEFSTRVHLGLVLRVSLGVLELGFI